MCGANEVESLLVGLRDNNLTNRKDISRFYVSLLLPHFTGMIKVHFGDTVPGMRRPAKWT